MEIPTAPLCPMPHDLRGHHQGSKIDQFNNCFAVIYSFTVQWCKKGVKPVSSKSSIWIKVKLQFRMKIKYITKKSCLKPVLLNHSPFLLPSFLGGKRKEGTSCHDPIDFGTRFMYNLTFINNFKYFANLILNCLIFDLLNSLMMNIIFIYLEIRVWTRVQTFYSTQAQWLAYENLGEESSNMSIKKY